MEISREETFIVPEYAITALEYGDFSGLTEEETEAVMGFIRENELGSACLEYSEESFFSNSNDVDDYGGTVVEVKATWLE